ncbi:hypothetical protein FSPOR_3707 [Fusarium sporotrichioides]|uniref:Uncharacterized protein n=1 Tax=Fusarium sporotrichioides TaxID=5514 RepID=A0A395SFZ5_FUSSP|nr:hypothetical protein FSPOR_3707 [Fusarium sporotrichioides]
MKSTTLATTLIAAVLPLAQADFDIFLTHRTIGSDHEYGGKWAIWDRGRPNTCSSVFDSPLWAPRNDVSGDKTGVRCKGACGYMGPTRDIEQLEMNFRSHAPVYHWTIYKDRNYGMYGLDGKKYGDCFVTTGNDYNCERYVSHGGGTGMEVIHGYRKFHCKTSFTAGRILADRE